jgi:hypothetical protein
LRAQSPPLLQAVYRVGKHGRVTRNPQQLEDQVPLECNSHVMHLNLTQDVQPSKEMSGGVIL